MKFGLSYNTSVYGTDPDQLIAVARQQRQQLSEFAGRLKLG
jgi:hypothetical protein